MVDVSTNWQPGEPAEPGPEPTPQWSQPPFASAQPVEPSPFPASPYPDQPSSYRPSLPDAVSGAVVVPATPVPPPSPAESTLRVISRLLAPILIAAAIFGGLPWFLAIIGIIVGGSALRQITRDMRRRRIAGAEQQRILPPSDQDLR